MKNKYLKILLYISVAFVIDDSQCNNEIKKYPLLMPNVRPNVPELYLCTPVKMNTSNTYYIVGYEPKASMNVAHHILIYGCKAPGTAKPVWNCGEMAAKANDNNQYNHAGPCSEGSEILYAWARDAPMLTLPEDVGFKVGRDSQIKYLVLQVHYAHIEHFKDGVSTDDSGIILHYTSRKLKKLAGVYLLGTMGVIPAMSREYMETACIFAENKVLHPFAYRTHTHALGKVVSGYVIKKDNNKWVELGKRDPLTPQMFYPVHNNVTITKGDMLAARCTMESNRSRDTFVGATGEDEMCNFYLMYYVDNDETVDMKYCFTQGPPEFYWKMFNLPNIPDDASTL